VLQPLVATLAKFATGQAGTAHARGPAARRYWSELLAMFTTERFMTFAGGAVKPS
jgi:hypothetical protein